LSKKQHSPHYLHLEHPKTKAPDDFWGQVSRTVNGEPVAEEDINLIVTTIRSRLGFTLSDIVLDIGCGNGALSRFFFKDISELHGVDFSSYLIRIAKDNFERMPEFSFTEADAVSYVESESNPKRYTKALCYGVFAYFTEHDAEVVLRELAQRFVNVSTLYIGNLPDRDLAHLFYKNDVDYTALLDDPLAAIGIWRSKIQMSELAQKCGWSAEFSVMPEAFYSSHYRYDVKLTRK
jgi:SAM-dependent methyltransferase